MKAIGQRAQCASADRVGIGGRCDVACGVHVPNVSFPRKRESSSFVDPRSPASAEDKLRGDDGWLRRYGLPIDRVLWPPTRTRGFEVESRPDASGRYACSPASGGCTMIPRGDK